MLSPLECGVRCALDAGAFPRADAFHRMAIGGHRSLRNVTKAGMSGARTRRWFLRYARGESRLCLFA